MLKCRIIICVFLFVVIPTRLFPIMSTCVLNRQSKTLDDNALFVKDPSAPDSGIGIIRDGIITIEKEVDLRGNSCVLPRGVTLLFKGGIIRNGTIIGDGTKISADGVAFDHVRLYGTWNVPQVSTSLFENLDYENSLKDVIALANPDIENIITIGNNNYLVSASEEKESCLTIPSNTEVRIEGTIRLKQNSLKSCNIISLTGNNIKLLGAGSIWGDRCSHTGIDGEWGMGVKVYGAKHILIAGLSINECWGDCLYIGGGSKDVEIVGCRLNHGRRQGVSITNADSVVIRNTSISNVHGTKPEYGIDLEPNKKGVVDNIIIDNVSISDCAGGILATIGSKYKETKRIGAILIANCTIMASTYYPVKMTNSERVEISGCKVMTNREDGSAIIVSNVGDVFIHNNIIHIKRRFQASLNNVAKKTIRRAGNKAIRVRQETKKNISDNKEVEVF